MQNQVERLEKQLAELEAEEKALQAVVRKGGRSDEEMQKGYTQLGDRANRIASVMEEWERTSAQLQELA